MRASPTTSPHQSDDEDDSVEGEGGIVIGSVDGDGSNVAFNGVGAGCVGIDTFGVGGDSAFDIVEAGHGGNQEAIAALLGLGADFPAHDDDDMMEGSA